MVGHMRINPLARDIVATTIGLAVVGGIIAATEFGPILVGCPIKGNISKNTGERIYHMPGQDATPQPGSIGFQASDGFAPRRTRARPDGGRPAALGAIDRNQGLDPSGG